MIFYAAFIDFFTIIIEILDFSTNGLMLKNGAIPRSCSHSERHSNIFRPLRLPRLTA